MRRLLVLVALGLTSAACSSSPTAPAMTATPAGTLREGRYTLNVFASPEMKIVDGISISTMVCLITGGPSSIAVPVDLERAGEIWSVRTVAASSLQMTLSQSSATLAGTVRGSAGAGTTSVSINGTSGEFATLIGELTAGISGRIQGEVRFDAPSGGQSCSGNAWTLVPIS